MSRKLYSSKKKNARIQTPDVSTAPASGMFESRPFVPQATTQSPLDLNDALMQSQRYGHNLSQIHSAIPSTPIQPKIGLGQPLQHQKLTPASGGSPLPKPVLQKMEAAFGANFSDVRIHEGSEAKSIGANAYTQGNHIHFQPGRYNPMSQSGQQLLGHELTHVVQQRAGQVAVPLGKDVPVNADPKLETEADEMSAKAVRGEEVQLGGSSSNSRRKLDFPIQKSPDEQQELAKEIAEETKTKTGKEITEEKANAKASNVLITQENQANERRAQGQQVNKIEPAKQQALLGHSTRKVEEQKALGQWNTNAQGRNQGLAHILDYAYARPPKQGFEKLEADTGGQPISGKDLREKHELSDKEINKLDTYELDKKGDGKEKKLLSVSTKNENGNVIKTNPEDSKQELNRIEAQKKEYVANFSGQKNTLKDDKQFQDLTNQVNEAKKNLANQTAYKVPREESKKGRIEQVETAVGKKKGSFKQDKGEIIGVTEALNELSEKRENEKTTGPKGGETTLKNPEWVKEQAGWTSKDNVKVPDTATSQSYTTGNEKQSLRVEKWGPNPETMKYSSVMGASTSDNKEQEKKKKKK